MNEDEIEFSYYSLDCGSEEEAKRVMDWLGECEAEGRNISLEDIKHQFPQFKLVRKEELPEEAQALAEQSLAMLARMIQDERNTYKVNTRMKKLTLAFFGFGSTAFMFFSRYYLNADLPVALWIVENWALWAAWVFFVISAVMAWPKDGK